MVPAATRSSIVSLSARNFRTVMVALRGDSIVDVPLAEALRKPKRVDPEGDLVRAARALGVEVEQEGAGEGVHRSWRRFVGPVGRLLFAVIPAKAGIQ
jgi:hypothetical protein